MKRVTRGDVAERLEEMVDDFGVVVVLQELSTVAEYKADDVPDDDEDAAETRAVWLEAADALESMARVARTAGL